MTLQEQYVKALQRRGNTLVPCKSKNWYQLASCKMPSYYYFVGPKGSVRLGQNKSTSAALSEHTKMLILRAIQ